MSTLLVPVAVAVLVLTGRRLVAEARARRHRTLADRRAVEVLRGLAGEVAAGSTTMQALQAVADEAPARDRDTTVRPVVAAAAATTDEPSAAAMLRSAPSGTAPPGLVALAAALSVSAATGAPLADLLARLAAAATREADDRREVQSVLAGPRTTARLLAGLPVLGLLLAASAGGHPLGFLLGRPAGRVCLLVGVGLDAVGLRWIERFARSGSP